MPAVIHTVICLAYRLFSILAGRFEREKKNEDQTICFHETTPIRLLLLFHVTGFFFIFFADNNTQKGHLYSSSMTGPFKTWKLMSRHNFPCFVAISEFCPFAISPNPSSVNV